MHGVTVDEERAAGVRIAGEPQRVRVVAVEAIITDDLDRQTVPRFEVRNPGDEHLRGVARDQHGVGQTDLRQITQDHVQDRELAVHRQQRLGQRIGIRPQALTLAGRENEPNHVCPLIYRRSGRSTCETVTDGGGRRSVPVTTAGRRSCRSAVANRSWRSRLTGGACGTITGVTGNPRRTEPDGVFRLFWWTSL